MVRKKLIPAFLTVILLYGGGFGENRSIEETIRIYLKLLVESSISEEKVSLKDFQKKFSDVAGKEISRKLYFWIQSWHDSNLYMDARLKKLVFVKKNIKNGKAEVQTDETWKYRYINRGTDRIVIPDTVIYYKILYRLVKKNGKWIITEIKVIDERK
ncbi:MAG: hypothetical protein GXO05_00040 [Aquificae bacterium]|nr:hypothetical protein [Aquificota bacterium]